MDERKLLTEQFEANRKHLGTVAYRMLGSRSEAEDAVQEAWLRLSRTDTSDVENLGGWLTTVVARVCLDMLRSKKSRREEPLEALAPDKIEDRESSVNPERDTLMADSVGLAMLVVLETLTPPERVAFVLHDMFDLPFDDIAPIVGRTPAAARQLASRARRRVQGANPPETTRERQRKIVDAFLAAARDDDFSALLEVLDPEVVLHADPVAVQISLARQAQGVPAPQLAPEIRGSTAVAETFFGRAQAARMAIVDGAVGLVWAVGERPRAVFSFTIVGDKIVAIDLVADPERISELDIAILAG
jgi:RNA polymerase sigma factor (sigma-70 family)